jgi:CheY-like chemotaxis protein
MDGGVTPGLTSSPKEGHARPAQILIADDELVVRALLTATLSHQGYELFAARNGAQALALAHELRPEIVLLDVEMPGLDGLEVCRQLKADPTGAPPTVILITGLEAAEHRTRGEEAGADAYLTKPFSPLTILQLLDQVTAPSAARERPAL